MLFRFLSLTFLLLSYGFVVPAQVLPLDPQVKTGKLTNGFTYYIRHNSEPKDRVTLYLANKVGSVLEDEDQRGLAHFMEHMNFNGTKHYPKNQLIDYLEKAGVRFGADINAYTGFDETVYQLPLPSDDPSVLQQGLQIMRDWAADATLDDEEIEKERGVIMEEKRMRSGAAQRLMDQYFPLQTNSSRYAYRMPIGLEKVILGCKPQAIKRFYADWYRPNLQALIVVGDIDVKDMEQKIRNLFGNLKNPVSQRERKTYKIPLTGRNQFFTATDPELTTTTLEVLIKQPELHLKTRQEYRQAIVRGLLNAALADRLQELSQQPDIPFIQAKAGTGGFMGGLDAFSVSVTSKPGKLKESFSSVWSLMEQYKKFGITATELQRQKSAYLSRLERAVQEKDKTPSENYVQEYLQLFLKDAASPGIDEEYKITQESLPAISVQEVNKAIQSVMQDVNRDIIILAPATEKEHLPDEAQVNSWIKQAEQSQLTAYKDNFDEDQLLPALPQRGAIVSKEYLDSVGVTKISLSNGATVYIKPSRFKNDEVLFSVFSEGGSSLYPDSAFQSAANAAQLIAAGGVGRFSQQQLSKLLAGKTVSVQPFINERYEGMQGGAAVKDLEVAMQLLYLYFTAPRGDTALFANIISRSKAAIQNRGNDPAAVFKDSVTAILGMHHFRRMPVSPQTLDSLNLDRMYEIYKERFSNAGDFSFVFVGSIDTAKLFPLIEEYIAALPSTGPHEKARDLGIHIPVGRISQAVHKGNDNKAIVRLVFSGDYTFNAADNIQLSALGSVLQYRMTERIRETEGGTYTPQAGVSYSKYPRNRYSFTVAFTCAPGNVEKLIAAANEEINKLKKQGPPPDDIQKFVAEETRSREINLRSNPFWLQYLSYVLQNDEPLASLLDYSHWLKTVSVASVQQAATRYLDDSNYIRLVLMPESK